MKSFVWVLLVLLIVLHQDFWYWNDGTIVCGFVPIGLAYHIGLSLAAAGVWWLATKHAWPVEEGMSKPK
jgi:Protein of unknown function (DUF3311)